MTGRRKILLSLAVVLLVFLVAAAAVGWWWSRGGRPQRSGEATLAGLAGPVTVRWDERAVPYVEAGSIDDLAAALGWLHANDRMLQMELGRRLAAGRLAELVGEAALAADTRSRQLRYRHGAERLWREAGPESRRWLEGYAHGVNAWLAARGGDLPPGLRLVGGLGFAPGPWSPVDSLSFVFLMGEDLSFWGGFAEEERFRWLSRLGEERTRDLLGGELHVPVEIAEMAAALASDAADGTILGAAPELSPPVRDDGSPGSNNWALDGRWTASGAPLLANDPHLPPGLPGTWYQVHLRAPDFEVAGMTLPGLPGVVIGRGRTLAWAFTNVMLDDHDLFFERVEPGLDGRDSVLRGERWVPVEEAFETVTVADGTAVEVAVRWTDRGVLLAADRERGLPPRSLAWTLYEGGDPLSVSVALAAAGSLEEALAGLDGYRGPAQNLVLAHPDGGIAWTVLGRLPARRAGDGRLPSPGWSPEYGWDGLAPRSLNPTRIAPADGMIVTANARITEEGEADWMTAGYDTPYRAERIRQVLLAGDRWDVAKSAALQNDVVSLHARDLLARAFATLPPELPADAAAARDLLAGWDGTMASRDAAGRPLAAAALFPFFERALREGLFADEEEAFGVGGLGDREHVLGVFDGTLDGLWADDLRTPERETAGGVAAVALARAWSEATERWGRSTDRWRYEGLHRLTLSHPLGSVPLLGRFFERGPFPMPGSATTVAAFGGRWRGDGQRVTNAPSMRWIVDLADPDGAVTVLPAGQSGHPFDPHYDDQIAAYREGRTFPFPWTAAAIERQTVERLELLPAATSRRDDAR